MIFILLLLILSNGVSAKNDGRILNVDPEISYWIKSLKDQNGSGCCDTADGYPAEAEYTVEGRYRVRIEGKWFDVSDTALITKPNRLGYAVVWYYGTGEHIKIRCFIPGVGG